MSTELFSDVVDLSNIHVKEALEDGSFSYTDGNSPSAELKLVVRGAFEAYPAYMAVVNYLQRTYGDEDGYVSMCNIPLSSITLNKLACDYAYTAECSFQFEEDTTGNSDDGSANSRDSNRRGTSPNNPIINNADYQMPEIQSSDFQYANTGGSMHITHAYKQVYYYLYPEMSSPTNYNNGININEDGNYEGVDVVCPAEMFSVTVSAPYYWLNSYYRTMISECTGCTNEEPFWGYPTECVLFKGITASPVALNYTDINGDAIKSWYWRIRYEFEARQGILIPSLQENRQWRSNNDDDVVKTQNKMATLKNEIINSSSFITNVNFDIIVAVVISVKGLNLQSYANALHLSESKVKKDFAKIAGKINQYCALKSSLEKGDRTKSIYKPGFRYIWFSNPKKDVGSSSQIKANYFQANVAQVYPTFDFNNLNLPEISDAD